MADASIPTSESWAAVKPGDEIEMQKYKWNCGDPEWTVAATVMDADDDSLVVVVSAGARYILSGDGVWQNDETTYQHFYAGERFNVVFCGLPYAQWYCNVITAARLDGNRLRWVDVDIDVEAFSDGTWWIADIPEFAASRDAYPDHLIADSLSADETLSARARNRSLPHAGQSVRQSTSVRHVFWSLARAGDGVAVVDSTLDGQVVSRALEAYAPDRILALDETEGAALSAPPPEDGLLVVASSSNMDAAARAALLAGERLGLRSQVRVILVPESEASPLAELKDAVDGSTAGGVPSVRLARLLAGAPGKFWVAVSPEFTAAGWF